MAVGTVHEPIDFAGADGKPGGIVILLVSPVDQTGPHIQALARISRLMLDEKFRRSFRQAASADELYQLISSKENE